MQQLSVLEPTKSTNPSLLHYERLTPDTLEDAVNLLHETRTPVAGVVDTGVYRGMCRDALAGHGAFVLVALRGNKCVAVTLSIRSQPPYWPSFLLRRPLCCARVVAKRLMKRIQRASGSAADNGERLPAVEEIIQANRAGHSWTETAPSIAKLLFTQVEPAERGKGIVPMRLISKTLSELKKEGFVRVDTRISRQNSSSARIANKLGMSLYADEEDLFGVRFLTESD